MKITRKNLPLVLALVGNVLGLLFSLIRDFYLPKFVDGASIFASLVSVCALITVPFGERVQYGLNFDFNKTCVFLSIIFGVLSVYIVANLEIIHDSQIFLIALFINIVISLLIAVMCGILSLRSGPHVIRLVGPIFPIFNIIFIFFNLGAITLAVSSYVGTLIVVSLCYLVVRPKSGHSFPSSQASGKRLSGIISLMLHYVAFFSAHGLVLLNLFVIIPKTSLWEQRLPIYIYSAFSFLIPYRAILLKDHFHKVKISSFIVALLLVIFLIIWIIYFRYFSGIILMIEGVVLMIICYIAYKSSLSNVGDL